MENNVEDKLKKLKGQLELCVSNANLQIETGRYNSEDDKNILLGKSEGYTNALEFIYRLFEM